MNTIKKLTIAALLACMTGTAFSEGVGASLLTQQHPFYIELANAMKSKAKEQNIPLEISIANQDLSKQLADVEDLITKGIDVLIISPVDSKGVLPAIKKAQNAGVKVITVDIPAEGIDVLSYIGTDNYKGGEKAGNLMAKVLNGKGEVAIINYPTVQSVVARIDGFKKSLSAYPEIKIVAEQTGITRAEALAAAQNMLQANPDIDGIFGFGDDAALAAAVAVKSTNLQDKVKVIGFDGMKEARDAVDSDPIMVGVIQQYPNQMGEQAIITAAKLIKGEAAPSEQPIEPGIYTGSK